MQWLALDTQFFAKPFPIRLQERFGPTGVCLFIAFLCACKRNSPQGEISFSSDVQALQELGLHGQPLVDAAGNEWSLEDFWAFTGRMKQTKKTARGRVKNVKCTHWERWQDRIQRDQAAERQRRSRAKNGRDTYRDTSRDNGVTTCVTENESEIETQTHPGAWPPDPASTNNFLNPRARGTNPRAKGTNPRALAAESRRETIPDWQPDPTPNGEVVDPAVVANLRANLTGGHQ
jgi:hypothetical protein